LLVTLNSLQEVEPWEPLHVELAKAQVGITPILAKRSTAGFVVVQESTKSSGQHAAIGAVQRSSTELIQVHHDIAKTVEINSKRKPAPSQGVLIPSATNWVGIMSPLTVSTAKPNGLKGGLPLFAQERACSVAESSSGRRPISGLTFAPTATPKKGQRMTRNGELRAARGVVERFATTRIGTKFPTTAKHAMSGKQRLVRPVTIKFGTRSIGTTSPITVLIARKNKDHISPPVTFSALV
jgi:hypothetical protein